MSDEARDVLVRARARIADPAHWTRRTYARDRVGASVLSWDPEACSWCACGAVNAERRKYVGDTDPAFRLLVAAAQTLGNRGPVDINESADHATVLRMFDVAIEMADQQ